MADVYTLSLTFDTDNDKPVTFSLEDVRDDITSGDATNAMDSAIASGALVFELTGKRKATLSKKDVRVLYEAA